MNIYPIFANFIAEEYLSIDNDSLEKYCRQKSIESGDQNSHSTYLDLSSVEVKPLVSKVEEKLDEVARFLKIRSDLKMKVYEAWCNVHYNHHIYRPHNHLPFTLSAVYYVRADEGSGLLELSNPSIGMHGSIITRGGVLDEVGMYTSSCTAVKPESGKLIIFPSWMQHWVLPGLEGKERISIAFDADIMRV